MLPGQAVLRLADAADEPEGEDQQWVTDVLLRRMMDDDPGVAAAALESPLLLARVPATAAFDGLRTVLARACAALAAAAGPADKAGPRGTAKRVHSLQNPLSQLLMTCFMQFGSG